MSLEDLSMEARDELALLARQLSENPATRKEFLRLTKKAKPDMPIPELEIEDKTDSAIEQMRKENQELRAKMQEKEAMEELEKRLGHIRTPLTLSIVGCVVNGPGEARETDIGLTGGGKGNHMVYVSGVADHKITDDKLLDHIVELVEQKAAAIDAANATAPAPQLAAVH